MFITSDQKFLIDWVHPVYSIIHSYQQHPLLGASPDGMFLYSLVAKDALSVNFIDGSFLSLVPKLFAFSFSRICERNEERKQHKSVCVDWLNLLKGWGIPCTHCTLLKKKKRNDVELCQKFVYDVAQKFLQDFNFADQQPFNVGIYPCYGKSLVFLAEIFRESCLGRLLQLHLLHAVEILQNYRGS